MPGRLSGSVLGGLIAVEDIMQQSGLAAQDGLNKLGTPVDLKLGGLVAGAVALAALDLGTDLPGFGDRANLWLLLLIVLVAASLSSVAGFAFGALAGPPLIFITGSALEAVQIMLVASIATQTYCVLQLRPSISLRALVPYLAGGFALMPLGVFLLLNTPLWIHSAALGLLLTAYGTYMVFRRPLQLKTDSLIGRIAAGAVGGITGPTAAFPAPLVTVWCASLGLDKQQQRAIYQPYILAMQLAALALLATVSPATSVRATDLMFIVPALLGARIGLAIYNRLDLVQFNRVVTALLLVSGCMLALKAVWS
jgi:uncharacterized membrane protein YfcA